MTYSKDSRSGLSRIGSSRSVGIMAAMVAVWQYGGLVGEKGRKGSSAEKLGDWGYIIQTPFFLKALESEANDKLDSYSGSKVLVKRCWI